MQAERVRFTDYGEKIANATLTWQIGVVGVTQEPPSINEVVYMCYIYEGIRYVFGRILVSRIGNLSKWPEDHDFVAYCQSNENVEFCSPIAVEVMSEVGCCDIDWHLDSGTPIEDVGVIRRLNKSFEMMRLDKDVRPVFEIPQSAEEEAPTVEEAKPRKVRKPLAWRKVWKSFVDWFHDVDPEPVDPDVRNF